jgi:phage terminase large subunit
MKPVEALELNVSPVFVRNAASSARIVGNQGGTRSGKTYSIVQLFTLRAMRHKEEFDIIGPTLPHLKKGAISDFRKIMENAGWWNDDHYNYTDRVYEFPGGGKIQFFSADNGEKMRGPGRDYAFINELNLLEYDAWKQILLRTRKQVFFDFNPVEFEHWIQDRVLPRDDCEYIHSTYMDNLDFLPPEQVREIERMRDEDPDYWQIYGLGERAHIRSAIYSRWEKSQMPETADETIYGLDFGYNNPTALVKIIIRDKTYYCEELLYESYLTNADVIERMKDLVGDKRHRIYADAAEPNRIEEIRKAGFNIHAANKSVSDGIDYLQRHKLMIDAASTNLLKEIRTYKWQENKSGDPTSLPVKIHDHALDALRYGMYTHYKVRGGAMAKPIALGNMGMRKNSAPGSRWAGY